MLDELILNEAIRLYTKEKKTMKEISKILGITLYSLSRHLKNKNVEIRGGRKQKESTRKLQSKIKKRQVKEGKFKSWNDGKKFLYKSILFNREQTKEIIILYRDKKLSSYKIAEMFNCTGHPILRILKVNKVQIRRNNKHTEETKKKMSKTKTKMFKEGKIKISGRALDCMNNPGKYSGKNCPMYGVKRSEEYKRKSSESRRGIRTPALISASKRLKELMEEGKIMVGTRNTSIELKIQNFLKELKIDFFTHQYIKEIKHAYQCDIFIPSMNLVIECDGYYWHANPNTYPPNFIISKARNKIITAKDIWEKDAIRTKELKEEGYRIIRLWEKEIKEMGLSKFQEILRCH